MIRFFVTPLGIKNYFEFIFPNVEKLGLWCHKQIRNW